MRKRLTKYYYSLKIFVSHEFSGRHYLRVDLIKMPESETMVNVAEMKNITFTSDRFSWHLADCEINSGEWLCFSPQADDIYPDASVNLARIIAAVETDYSGELKLLGQTVAELGYDSRLELRRKIGYIHSSGALLANRSILENIRYPLDLKAGKKLDIGKTNQEILQLMIILGISPYSDYRPHHIDEIIRWRACLCRALVINPQLLLFEGIGDWSYSHGNGLVWHYLKDQHRKQPRTVCFCLPKKNPYFENWLIELGGRVIPYYNING